MKSKLSLPPKQRLQFNMALAYFERLARPLDKPEYHPVTKQFMGNRLVLESEKELDQWYFEFKRFPLTEDMVDHAFKQMSTMVKHYMKKEGLIR